MGKGNSALYLVMVVMCCDEVILGRALRSKEKEPYQVFGNSDFHGLVGQTEDGDDFSDSVGSVVEGEQGVPAYKWKRCQPNHGQQEEPTIRPTLDSAVRTAANDGLQELIRNILCVVLLDRLDRVIRLLPDTANKAINGNLHSLPSLIPVHGVVPTDNGRQLTHTVLLDEVQQLLSVDRSGSRSGVSSVSEEVDVDMRDADFLGHLEEGEQVADVRVNTAVGNEAEQVESAVGVFGVFHGFNDPLGLVELVTLDGWASAVDGQS